MKNKGYVLAVHLNSNGSEGLVFDMDGHVQSRACAEKDEFYPRDGWVDYDAEEICTAAIRAIEDALIAGDIAPRTVKVIGVTSECEAMLLWEKRGGKPLGCAISRLGEEGALCCDELLSRRVQKMVQDATGMGADPCRFAGFKLGWMLDALPGLRERAERNEIACGTLDSWLVSRLTGGRAHITHHSNALRTRLYDTRSRSWNRQLLELLGIPAGILPEMRSLDEGFGETDPRCFFGMHGIPIAGIAEEQKAVLFG